MLIVSDLSIEENNTYIGIRENNSIYCKENIDLKKCLGCFNCWTKTPGCCVINDTSRKINEDAINSNNFVVITEITYGGYSASIKNIMDRMIPNILPYFKVINKETHHAPRYTHYPNFIVIGYGNNLSDEEKSLFNKLVKANAINMQFEKYQSIILNNKKEIANIINSIGGKENE